jgi:hypothetical protein
VLQWCQSGMQVVRYVQRPWGIHIDRGESRIERGVVRKQMDVPLQAPIYNRGFHDSPTWPQLKPQLCLNIDLKSLSLNFPNRKFGHLKLSSKLRQGKVGVCKSCS